MKPFTRRYQIGLFFLLILFIGYYPWWGFGIMGFFPGGLSIAGVIIVTLAGGRKGLKEMLQRWLKWRVNWHWYAVVSKEMTLSERTITTHVTHILSKLGFNSRTQIAAWAVEKGLLKLKRD